MTKDELLVDQQAFYNNVQSWALSEMSRISREHNMHFEDFSILRVFCLESDEVHEPYSHHRDTDLDDKFEDVSNAISKLYEDLSELGFKFQSMIYNEEHKLIY